MILSFAVIKETAYFAIDEIIYTETESGAIVEEPKHNCYLLGVNLKSGKQVKLTEPKNDFNNSLKIVAADENRIYMTYNYFENYFYGTNFKDANENFEYNINTNKLTSVLEDNYIIKAQLIEDVLLTVESRDDQEDNNEKIFTISKYNLSEEKSKVITTTKKYPIFNDREWIYRDDETNQYYSLDFETMNPKKSTMSEIKDVYIYEDAKDYYYISYLEKNEMKYGFILKADYKKGNKKIISVN